MTLFDRAAFDDHEGVHLFSDAATGLRAIIAVHSTARGPAAGGTRFWSYADDDDALTDALRLSRGMSYKNAVADIPFGGGKGVVLRTGDSVADADRRDALFAAYGRAINSLGGVYVTAEDVGVTPQDMQAVARGTRHVAGLPDGDAASGDPSPVTARGVFQGLKACVRRRLGRDDLTGLRVAVQGTGHVGARLCAHLAEAGARLVVADVNAQAAARVAEETGAELTATEAIYDADVDVFAPCALGAVLNPDTVARLRCSVVAGGANNQLSEAAVDAALVERGILYAPDYVINGGGVINVAGEILAAREGRRFDPNWVEAKLAALIATLESVLDRAIAGQRPTQSVADELARARLAPQSAPVPA